MNSSINSVHTYTGTPSGIDLVGVIVVILIMIMKMSVFYSFSNVGTPSGIDNSVSTYGGLCQFACGHIDVLPSPKVRKTSLCHEHCFDSQEKLEIMLVNTKVPRDTKAMVAKVTTSTHVDLQRCCHQH